MKRVCVFCASSAGTSPVFLQAAATVGGVLAARGLGVVYGGAKVGMMGALADAALAAGGEVHGVIPAGLAAREVAHERLTTLEVVDSMHIRKQRMHALSDGFLTLPGGFGTLDELFETLTWAQIGVHQKPVALLSAGPYFDPLLQFLDGAVESGLLQAVYRDLLLVDRDADVTAATHRLVDRMAAWQPPSLARWLTAAQT